MGNEDNQKSDVGSSFKMFSYKGEEEFGGGAGGDGKDEEL